MSQYELMIGNWVRFENEAYQIEVLELYYANVSRKELAYFKEARYRELSPLPITPEWLALLGFDNVSIIKKEFGQDVLKCANSAHKNQIYVCIQGPLYTLHLYRRCFNINSIHHLQNILQVLYGITLSPTMP